jgi:hypothetical protein
MHTLLPRLPHNKPVSDKRAMAMQARLTMSCALCWWHAMSAIYARHPGSSPSGDVSSPLTSLCPDVCMNDGVAI